MVIINVGDEAVKKFHLLRPPDMKPKEFLMLLLKRHEEDLKGQPQEDYWKAFRENIQQAIIEAAEYLFKKEDNSKAKEPPSDNLVIE